MCSRSRHVVWILCKWHTIYIVRYPYICMRACAYDRSSDVRKLYVAVPHIPCGIPFERKRIVIDQLLASIGHTAISHRSLDL